MTQLLGRAPGPLARLRRVPRRLSRRGASARPCLRAVLEAQRAGRRHRAGGGLERRRGLGLLAAALCAARAPRFAAGRVRAVHIDHGLQAAAAALSRGLRQRCAGGSRSRSPSCASRSRPGRASRSRRRRATPAMPRLRAELQPRRVSVDGASRAGPGGDAAAAGCCAAPGSRACPPCRSAGRFGPGWHLRPLLDVTQRALAAFRRGPRHRCGRRSDESRCALRSRLSAHARLAADRGALAGRSRGARAHGASSRRGAAACWTTRPRHDAAGCATARRCRCRACGRSRLREQVNALRFWLRDAGVEPPSTLRLSRGAAAGVRRPRPITCRRSSGASMRCGAIGALVPDGRDAARARRVARLAHRSGIAPPARRGPRGAALGRATRRPRCGAVAGVAHRAPPQRRRDAESRRRGAKRKACSTCVSRMGVLPWMRDALPLVFAGDALIAVGRFVAGCALVRAARTRRVFGDRVGTARRLIVT